MRRDTDALGFFGERGFDENTVDDIAETAGTDTAGIGAADRSVFRRTAWHDIVDTRTEAAGQVP